MIKKPWGHELILETNPRYTVKQIYVKAGHRLSLQYHKVKSETMICVSGKAFLEAYNQRGQITKYGYMQPYVPYCIQPWTMHRLAATDEDAIVVEVSSSQLDDVVRMDDDYGRAK